MGRNDEYWLQLRNGNLEWRFVIRVRVLVISTPTPSGVDSLFSISFKIIPARVLERNGLLRQRLERLRRQNGKAAL
jgi:hypothetical protein